jgi:hypothetical protein
MKLNRVVVLSLLVLTSGFVGCGGSSSSQVSPPPPPPPAARSISSILPTSTVAGGPDLTLIVTGSNLIDTASQTRSSVVWSMNGTETFLATTDVSDTQLSALVPASLLTETGKAQIQVQAFFKADDSPKWVTNSVSFKITPAPAATTSVFPALVTLGPGRTQQFAATMNGNSAVTTWEIQEGTAGGSITASGLYTVPPQVGIFHVIATFMSDPSKNAVATISVVSSGFITTSSMNTARSGHTATLLANGKVLIVGGGGADLDASAELFDPASGTFAPTGSMTTPRAGATATLLANGNVLIVGGFGPGVSMLPKLDSAELYDPQTGSFAVTGSMATGRVNPTATLLIDGRVLIAGGLVDGGGGGAATASSELYDPTTGTFTISGSMISARADHTATLLASGKVLIVGGWNGHRADAADDPPWDPLFAELFDPASGSFKESGSMSTTRLGHSSIRLSDGNVLVLGGVLNLQNLEVQPADQAYAELYAPTSGTFSSVGSFTLTRAAYSATLLDSGAVLIAGGEDAGIIVPSATLLDPATGIATATGGLVTARKGHTATRLNDGRVLVTGGTDGNGNVLASAEVYK